MQIVKEKNWLAIDNFQGKTVDGERRKDVFDFCDIKYKRHACYWGREGNKFGIPHQVSITLALYATEFSVLMDIGRT